MRRRARRDRHLHLHAFRPEDADSRAARHLERHLLRERGNEASVPGPSISGSSPTRSPCDQTARREELCCTKPTAGITLQMNPPPVRKKASRLEPAAPRPEMLQGTHLPLDDTLTVWCGLPASNGRSSSSRRSNRTPASSSCREQDPNTRNDAQESAASGIEGNKFHGNLSCCRRRDGKLGGWAPCTPAWRERDAKAGRVVLSRYGRPPATAQTVVQIYTGDIVPSRFRGGLIHQGHVPRRHGP